MSTDPKSWPFPSNRFSCIKCKGTGLRLEVNEYVLCDCEAGKAREPNPILAEVPFVPASPGAPTYTKVKDEFGNVWSKRIDAPPTPQKFSHELEKPLYSPAFATSVARTDAARLKAIAASMSYNTPGESIEKHALNEIAMRLETGFYAGGKP